MIWTGWPSATRMLTLFHDHWVTVIVFVVPTGAPVRSRVLVPTGLPVTVSASQVREVSLPGTLVQGRETLVLLWNR